MSVIYGNPITLGGGAGGSLAITVVGGTTQPVSPKDNTIWVNTDVAIGVGTFSPNAPESPAIGDVWVNTKNKYNADGTNASTNILAVSENPYLEINVLNVKQWNGTEWETIHGSAIYANGAWTAMALYLFNYGALNEDFSVVGYQSKTTGSTALTYVLNPTYVDNGIKQKNSTSNSFHNGIQFQPLVDISNYNVLKVVGHTENSGRAGSVFVGCSTAEISTTDVNGITGMGCATVGVSSGDSVDFELIADLSEWSGDAYVGVGYVASSANALSSVNLKVYQVVLTA